MLVRSPAPPWLHLPGAGHKKDRSKVYGGVSRQGCVSAAMMHSFNAESDLS